MHSYSDKDFGLVEITVNLRARSIVMRPKVDGLRVSIPPDVSEELVRQTLERYRDRLLQKQRKLQERHVSTEEEVAEMRAMAKRFLPNRVAELAYLYGFSKYKDVKIQSSKTRWGSCSGTNSINLSLYLMKLPDHLIDYVILHELCHTVHHNHSDKFWSLMDQVTNGKSKALRKELRNYDTM